MENNNKEFYKKEVEKEFLENQKDKWLERARKYINDPKKAYQLLYNVEKKFHEKYPGDPIGKLKKNIKLFYSVFSDWITGKYKGVSKNSLLMIVVGLLYFVVPVDIIPDWLIGVGFIDDATVLSLIINNIGKEISKYRKWHSNEK